jgi:hypothetical protein
MYGAHEVRGVKFVTKGGAIHPVRELGWGHGVYE